MLTLRSSSQLRAVAAALAAVLATAAVAPPAAAQARKRKQTVETAPEDTRAVARVHYAQAEKRFGAGDFVGAYTEYKAANDVLPAPQTLWKMATCKDKLTNAAETLAAYEAFLASNPPPSMQDRVQTASTRVAELKKTVPGRVEVASEPAGATITVDGKPAAAPTPTTLELPTGPHQLVFSAPGYEDARRQVDSAGGTTQSLKVTLAPAKPGVVVAAVPVTPEEPRALPPPKKAAPTPMPAPAVESRSNTTPYILLGAAGAGVIVGGVFGAKALADKSDFDGGTKTADKADAVERSALIADIAFGVAITLGVTGVVLMTSGGSKEQRTSLVVTPTASPHGAGAGASLTF